MSRCRRVTFVLIAVGSLVVRSVFAQSPQSAMPASASIASPVSAAHSASIVRQYCVGCHNQRTKTAGLSLDMLDLDNVPMAADVWERAVRKVRVGMMPPQGAPRPDPEARQALVTYLTRELDRAAAALHDPGRPLIRRLNRAEYANAVRDLVAIDVDASALLPPDDSAYGFDNNADALGVSPILLERYLTSAGKMAALAVGNRDIGPAAQTFRIRQDASQDTHIDGLPVGTVGGILANVTLPLDGEYDFQAKMFRTNLGIMRGLEYAHQLEFSVDGRRIHLSSLGGEEDFTASLKNLTKLADEVDARTHFKMRLAAGPHTIAVAFLQRTEAVNSTRLQPFIRSSHDPLDTIGHPHLDTFTLTGPFKPTGPGDTPSRRRVFVCRPASPDQEDACARRIIATLVRRGYRGQSTPVDVERLFSFYRTARKSGTFDKGVETALRAMLASPKFVFRAERDPAGLAAGTVYRVSDVELASRLSFFLWSSIPDDRLLRIARQRRLSDQSVLAAEVRRMIADPKADALVSNFAGQWLHLRNLKNFQPNSLEFPDFDDNLRQAMQRETELFVAAIMHEDRSALDLMTADFTFMNERLASHYGVSNVYGSQFRRVTLQDDARRGLLGKGAILMVTSHADRTSPVVRGKWILDNLLAAPPPPPPANVPPLNEDNQHGGKVLSMRERMEEHRKNPVCAGCHKLMDPIGLSMENFDAVGAWRTRDGGTMGTPIDASGELIDGTKVDGIITLRKALLRQPDLFVGAATEKLMIYALGRGLGPYDMPTVRSIVRDAKQHDYRFSSLILGIVNSVPFQMRMKVEVPNDSRLLKTASTR